MNKMKTLNSNRKINFYIITFIVSTLLSLPSHSLAQGYGAGEGPASPQTPTPTASPAAPSVELTSGAILRAQTILKGKPIVFRNGKFELDN